jgi:uncharacterized oxidoreductase
MQLLTTQKFIRMKIENKTIMITGAGSGIGYAIAKSLRDKGNKVIIVGRNAEKIKKAGEELGLIAIASDISKPEDRKILVSRIKKEFGELSVLINNAGQAIVYKLGEGSNAFEKAKAEFEINYFAPVDLTEQLLPVLKNQPEAAVVNITSNTVYHPVVVLPTYSDSKAALHSHTVALRHRLAEDSKIQVYEVLPSLINTESAKEIGGEQNGLPPSVVADGLVSGFENNEFEIYVGETSLQRSAYLANPEKAFLEFNKGL